MAGITVAHHDGNQDSFAYQPARRKSVSEEQMSHFLAPSPSASDPSVEDLTTEMQEYMLRETMAPWLGAWSADQSSNNNETTFGSQDLFHLEQLFVPDEQTSAELYDEITFVPEPLSLNPAALSSAESTPVASPHPEVATMPSAVEVQTVAENRKRRRSSYSSSEEEEDDDDDSSSSSSSEAEQAPYQARSQWSMYSDDSSSDSDSESEDEDRPSRVGTPSIINDTSYAYMHKRQMEETLLQKITQQLHQDKLPGILSILSSENNAGQHSDEVEIDLSRLARDQLIRLLSYVEACIAEQNGGPAVNLSDYVTRPAPQPTKRSSRPSAPIDSSDESDIEPEPRQRRRQRRKQRASKKSRQSEDVDDLGQGPISMASLTKRTRRKGRSRKSDDTAAVVSNSALDRIPRADSIAVTRPKRRAALKKKNQFEDITSDAEGSDDGTLIVFGDEQMDFRVTDNKTIVHETSSSTSTTPAEPVIVSTVVPVADDDDDEDEEIDIML